MIKKKMNGKTDIKKWFEDQYPVPAHVFWDGEKYIGETFAGHVEAKILNDRLVGFVDGVLITLDFAERRLVHE